MQGSGYIYQQQESLLKLRKVIFNANGFTFWNFVWTPITIFRPIIFHQYIHEYVFIEESFASMIDSFGNIFQPAFVVLDYDDLIWANILSYQDVMSFQITGNTLDNDYHKCPHHIKYEYSFEQICSGDGALSHEIPQLDVGSSVHSEADEEPPQHDPRRTTKAAIAQPQNVVSHPAVVVRGKSSQDSGAVDHDPTITTIALDKSNNRVNSSLSDASESFNNKVAGSGSKKILGKFLYRSKEENLLGRQGLLIAESTSQEFQQQQEIVANNDFSIVLSEKDVMASQITESPPEDDYYRDHHHNNYEYFTEQIHSGDGTLSHEIQQLDVGSSVYSEADEEPPQHDPRRSTINDALVQQRNKLSHAAVVVRGKSSQDSGAVDITTIALDKSNNR